MMLLIGEYLGMCMKYRRIPAAIKLQILCVKMLFIIYKMMAVYFNPISNHFESRAVRQVKGHFLQMKLKILM